MATFIITFGLGRHLLHDHMIERDYGLKVALNSIGKNALRCIDKASHERTPLNSRTQASKGVDIFELAVNTELDLLTAITGSSKVEKFGAQVTGRDALTLTVKTGLGSLCGLLDETYDFYLKNDYKEDFGWIDNFRRVRDEITIRTLDLSLLDTLKSNPLPDNCWLSEPEIIDWESSVYYVLNKKGKKTQYFSELKLEKLVEFLSAKLGDNPLTIDDLNRHPVCITDDNYTVLNEWSAYRCIYTEIKKDGCTYILQNGGWFKVEDGFVDSVNSVIENIDIYSHALPDYDHKEEGDYNQHVSTYPSYVLMDKKNITHGGGRSKIEYCDLIKDGVDLIHVKRGTSSSTLSHLFAQGEISAELLSTDVEFRKKLNSRLPDEIKLDNVEERPDVSLYKIVYAIVSEKRGDLSLPFFSKVRLKNALYHLDLLGYKVAIAKIDVSDDYRVKSKYK